jgi:hypothetical protein
MQTQRADALFLGLGRNLISQLLVNSHSLHSPQRRPSAYLRKTFNLASLIIGEKAAVRLAQALKSAVANRSWEPCSR